MGFRRTIAYPAAYGILSGFAVAVGWPAAAPVLAAGPDIDLHNAHLWVTAWILFLMVGVLLGYLHLNRRVGRKTAELRRELFERQMAEKELLASQQKLRRSLAEKEALLKEIHHRVKNNLQIVSSLLYLQEDDLEDPKGVEMLRESQNRVKSMALIHEQLYTTSDLAKIDFGRYLQGLTANLFDAYGIDSTRIRLEVRAEDVALGVDTAVPCGLIVNELVSNAIKHAFPTDRRGTIEIGIRRLTAEQLEIVVADDGIGISRKPDAAGRQSLGLRLVDTLTRQLDGTPTVETDAGTRYCIRLTIPETLVKDG